MLLKNAIKLKYKAPSAHGDFQETHENAGIYVGATRVPIAPLSPILSRAIGFLFKKKFRNDSL